MNYIVYVLYSQKFNKHYTGHTTNLEQRLLSHNDFGNEWTARYRPWKPIFTKKFTAKTEALKYEKWLKTGAGRDFIKTLPH
ncbi:MAG: GIY-YIG nuclease family protein [Niabella sp.]